MGKINTSRVIFNVKLNKWLTVNSTLKIMSGGQHDEKY